ncbi:Golgi apparatus membrane protein tvp18 [Blastocladiella emersonii ATCC 22665]|nr:Golgi apparatus membrane protein tvp18 [Blastocladiella emersonii ATCC 22665]
MGFIEELKSGNGTVYAQWGGLLSIIFLVIGGFSNLFSSLIVFAFIAWAEAFIMILLEIPVFQKCCPHGPRVQAFVKYFEGNYLRAVLYVGFSVLMWLTLTISSSFTFFILGALTTAFSAFCYGIAGLKKQERQPSTLTGANLGPGSLL